MRKKHASGEHGQEHFLTEKNQKYIRQIISGDNITGIFPKNNNPALATEYVAEKVFDLSEAIVDKVIDTEAVLRTKAKFTLIEKLIELIPGNQTDKAKEVLKVRMALEADKTNLKKDIGSLKNSILEFISNQGNDNDNQLEGDLFHVIAVNDVIDGKGGNDTIKGRKGQDVLSGGDGDDTLDGGDGDDWLYGDNGRDVLTGGDGNDVLDGGKGLDNLYGEKGDDVYIFEKGDGQDTIFDSQGWNIVYLKDIPSSEVEGTFDQFGAPAIRVKGTDQTIGFYQFNSGDKQRQQFVLAYSDNKKVLLRSGYDSPFRNLVGTDGNDKYSAFLKRTTIHGRAGDDELTGSSGADTLYGEEGKDTLNGREGNDTLIGGTGNDELYGGEGDDVYVFGTHFGSDQIFDNVGKNVLKFVDGFKISDFSSRYLSDDDVLLFHRPTNQSIRLNQFCWSEPHRNFDLNFSDGRIVDKSDIDSPFRRMQGTDGDDSLPMVIDSDSTYRAGAGKDSLYGTSGSDKMYGEDGDDRLEGNGGDDILDGGAGDDTLYGGEGDDIYIFGIGYGHDTIDDYRGKHTIRFNEGISPEDLYVNEGTYGSVTIRIKDNEVDKLTIKEFQDYVTWYGSTRHTDPHRDMQLQFSDGTIFDVHDERSPFRRVIGSDEKESISNVLTNGSSQVYGKAGDDTLHSGDTGDLLDGGAGDDHLYGNGGDDILDGGPGNDYLHGEGGDDTYLFGIGSGKDTMDDSSGLHTIQLKDNLSLADLYIQKTGEYGDVELRINGNDQDILKIRNFADFFTNWDGANHITKSRRNMRLRLADGHTVEVSDVTSPFRKILGTEADNRIGAVLDETATTIYGFAGKDRLSGNSGDDMLYGGNDDDELYGNKGDDKLYGEDGNDALYGNDGKDVLVGAEGEDKLYGGAGDDVLDGGTGNDRLDGAEGNDVYLFQTTHGQDTLYDSLGTNTIQFPDQVKYSDIIIRRTSKNIVLSYKDNDDSITFENFAERPESRNFILKFSDGTTQTIDSLNSIFRNLTGTAADETIDLILSDGGTI